MFLVDKEPLGLRGEVALDARDAQARAARAASWACATSWTSRRASSTSGSARWCSRRWSSSTTRSGSMACRRSSIRLREIPGMAPLAPTRCGSPAICAARCRGARPQPGPARVPAEQFILVTPGGGGDGAELIDWVIGAYEHDPGLPHQAVLLFGPVHAGRAAPRLPGPGGARPAAAARSPSRPGSSPSSSGRQRRGRDGRLQHVLRDPVVRQAGAPGAAHHAAAGAVSARRAGRRSWAWCGCWPTTACATRARMAGSLRELPPHAGAAGERPGTDAGGAGADQPAGRAVARPAPRDCPSCARSRVRVTP